MEKPSRPLLPFNLSTPAVGPFFRYLCVRLIHHPLGMLGTRVGEASHPGPEDAWSKYIAKQSMQNKQPKPPTRSAWVDCSVDMSLFQQTLPVLTPTEFCENAHGLVLLSRQLFTDVSKIRSTKALVAVLPGTKNEDLRAIGLGDSAISTHQLFIHDPLLDKWSHRHVTVVQLGAQCVLPTSLDNAPEWDTSTSAEFSLLLSRRLFVSDDAWTSFVTDCRRVVPNQICSLHKDFSSSTVEFCTWS